MVTDIAAQIFEFHMGKSSAGTYTYANGATLAGDHTAQGSNTSRLPTLEESLALYAANFGGNSAGGGAAGYTVGAVQAMTNTSAYNGYVAAEDNRPGGWAHRIWSAAPTPSGHASLYLGYGDLSDRPDGFTSYVSAVL